MSEMMVELNFELLESHTSHCFHIKLLRVYMEINMLSKARIFLLVDLRDFFQI